MKAYDTAMEMIPRSNVGIYKKERMLHLVRLFKRHKLPLPSNLLQMSRIELDRMLKQTREEFEQDLYVKFWGIVQTEWRWMQKE